MVQPIPLSTRVLLGALCAALVLLFVTRSGAPPAVREVQGEHRLAARQITIGRPPRTTVTTVTLAPTTVVSTLPATTVVSTLPGGTIVTSVISTLPPTTVVSTLPGTTVFSTSTLPASTTVITRTLPPSTTVITTTRTATTTSTRRF